MSKPDIRRASLEEIERMHERGELFYDPNAPEGPSPGEELPDDFWDHAVLVRPNERTVLLPVDEKVLEFFRDGTDDGSHIARMQAVLNEYVEAHKERA